MFLYIVLGIIAVAGLFLMVDYNSFIKLRNIVEEAFATMDVFMKKRVDLIPNLVETVKGYARHESETLEKVIEARNLAMRSRTISEKQAGENQLTGTLKSLFALSESYPELKADSQFLDLQQQLQKVEEDIANARKYYNAVVKSFNTKVESFPSNFVARLFGFRRKEFFTIAEAERASVEVKF
jgi:LemA protein